MKKYYYLLILLSSSLNAQIINFPDANFKAKLLQASPVNSIATNSLGNSIKIDGNDNGEIEVNEALNVYYLNVSSSQIDNVAGIENFTNMTSFYCNGNQLLFLNLNGLTSLRDVSCTFNQLSNLNLETLINLENISCGYNQLSSLNLNGLTSLKHVQCYNNQLSNINLDGLINLNRIECGNNQLTSLNLNGLENLLEVYCNNNPLLNINLDGLVNLTDLAFYNSQLTNVDLSDCVNLKNIDCSNTLLNAIDLSNAFNLQLFFCSNNIQLESINVKNGSTVDNYYIDFSNNPNLKFICADEFHLNLIQDLIINYGYTNCHVSNYCSFTPGGTFYTIQGNNKLDSDNNGCDVLDAPLLNLKFNITNGTNSGNLISDSTGYYSIPIQEGTYVLTPILENSTYFTIFPNSITVNFPAQSSPFIQDFCIKPNGVHPDLEISMLPSVPARPGFNATYIIVYKNKGNIAQSGTISLTLDDAILDLVSSNPIVSSFGLNNLSWNFINLLPFETREIALTLNVNSPMETPAVNNGDVLNYNLTITSPDESPCDNMNSFTLCDNVFNYNQTVVNSFDPNDKTCLEGAAISPSKVGDYVHYMIRFENNGTANAQNIVVKDMIDLAKFDINTLVPIKGSHSFVTNITEGNKVEFIFENINLPFDDANNDGYVAFKIKTKPTLVNGDTFSNSASIYFDYNFPILTNTATTTIAALSGQDFEFSNYWNCYPNPVQDILHIATKVKMDVNSISIYNTLGQLVIVIPNANEVKDIDVSSLQSGNYYLKINSEKGISIMKFVKL